MLAAGIEPVVISAATGETDGRFDHYRLLPWGPSGLRFDFRHIMQRRFGRGVLYRAGTLLVSIALLPFIVIERALFGLSNQASWMLPAAHLGTRLVRQGSVELVYSTGGAASAHHAAAVIKRRTGIPWIAEIHDPMILRDGPDDDGSALRRSRNTRYLQRLERRICRDADCVWWFTDAALAYARRRNPMLGERGTVILPGATPPGVTGSHRYGATLNLCHFGAITEDRSLAPLIDAIHAAIPSRPNLTHDLRIHVYGSALDRNTEAALARTGLHGLLVPQPRVPRMTASQRMQEADALLLLHGDYEGCAEYIPSKLYDYFWARRPVFALTNRNPSLDELLAQHGAYVSHTLDSPTIQQAVVRLYDDWQAKALAPQTAAPVTADAAVEQILERVARILAARREITLPDA